MQLPWSPRHISTYTYKPIQDYDKGNAKHRMLYSDSFKQELALNVLNVLNLSTVQCSPDLLNIVQLIQVQCGIWRTIDILAPCLTELVNQSFSSGVFPHDFKTTILRPFLRKLGLDQGIFLIWWRFSRFYFQQNTTMEQYQEKHFVDIRKHIETLLHLSVVTRAAAGLIKLATPSNSAFLSKLLESLACGQYMENL